jgi:AcrR family transcriptional regulator
MEKQIDSHKLFEEALKLYSRFGIRSVTMDDISRELGMSKKTIYQLVKDKEELLRKVLAYETSLGDKLTDRFSAIGSNAIDQLIEVNNLMHESRSQHNPSFYYDLRKHHPIIFSEWIGKKRERMYSLLILNMVRGKKEGIYRSELNHHIIAKLYMARMEMLNSTEVIEDEEIKSMNFFKEILIYHIHGICNSRGLDYFSLHSKQL